MSLAIARRAFNRVEELRSDMNAGAYGGYSLENPRTSWDRIFSVEPTYTGKAVTQMSAMQSMAVWACVRIISNAIGKIPLLTYARTDDGKQRAPDHYLWRTLKIQTNPYQTAFRWKRMMQAWLCLWGNAYAEIDISGRGQVDNLWPWRPDRVQMWSHGIGNPPEIPETEFARDAGSGIYYTYTRNNGKMVTLPSAMVLHLRGIETDGYMGLSPIGCARQSIGLALAAEEYGARFFGNNGRPGGFLKTPNKLSAEGRKNLRESFEDLHRGLRGAHRIGLLEEGLEYTDVGVPPEDMQFLQTRQFQAIDIARLFGVPPHKIAELSRATFSNIEHQSIEFVQDCLGDWMASWESECTSMLLSDREQQSVFLEFFPQYLLRGDLKSRNEAYNIAHNGGWMNANEIRDAENMNKIEGGDTFLQPLNMIATGESEADPDDPEGDTLPEAGADPDPNDPSALAATQAAAAAKLNGAKKSAKKKLPAPPAKKGA